MIAASLSAMNVHSSSPAGAVPHGDSSSASRGRASDPAFLLREPLLDAAENLVGYQLKLDHEPDSSASGADLGASLPALLASLEIAPLSEHRLLMLTVKAEELQQSILEQLPRNGLILAVRLPQDQPAAFAGALRQAWSQGYCIALDDYTYSAEHSYLLDAASYVRLDVSRRDGLQLAREASVLLEHSGVRLIAANLRSRDEFEACRQLPFDYYQGTFFTTARTHPEARIEQARTQVIELLNLVRQKAELTTIERALQHDPTLVYRLLRYINSPAVGLQREIRSISHAILMLGYQPLYRWLTLLLFASGPDAPRNRALLTHALVRGRLAELLGRELLGPAEADSLFVAGIFSMLDSLLGIPLRQALAAIRLAPALNAALLDQSGIYAPCLQLAIACEGPNRARVHELAVECRLDQAAVNAAHVQALLWAESLA